MIRRLHLESNGVYGARKIHRELLLAGEACGRHRVARLMRADRLKGYPKRRFRHRSNTTASIFDYIERFYNRKRTHAYLGYLTPVQYENQAVGT
jgi:putative transposase